MSTNAARLLASLREVLDGDVALEEIPPATFTVPSVVVTPGDPFLQPDTHGLIVERWDILIVVAMKDKAVGIGQMRDLSMLVRAAVSRVGGMWRNASGPRTTQGDPARAVVLSVNQVDFKTQPFDNEGSI